MAASAANGTHVKNATKAICSEFIVLASGIYGVSTVCSLTASKGTEKRRRI